MVFLFALTRSPHTQYYAIFTQFNNLFIVNPGVAEVNLIYFDGEAFFSGTKENDIIDACH